MVRNRTLAVGLLLAAGLHLPAQTPGSNRGGPEADQARPAQPSSTLLIRLRSSRIPLEQAQEITTELAAREVRVRLQASKILRTHYLRQRKDFEEDLAGCTQDIKKTVKQAQKRLLGRKGADKVEALRAQSLAVSRQSALTKSQIKQAVDPCIEELAGLLRPQLADVLEIKPKLDLAILELRMQHTELVSWFALYASIGEGLELHSDAAKHYAKYPVPRDPGGEERIDQEAQAAIFTGLPMSATDRKALGGNEAARSRIPVQEYLGTLDLNKIRYLLGLSMLHIDEKLADAARDHSKDMHTLGFFAHKSPVAGKTNFGQRAANFGTSAGAENIAAGQRTGASAIRAWWYSPGHHRNMLGRHRRTGLGQHEKMWTQMFGG